MPKSARRREPPDDSGGALHVALFRAWQAGDTEARERVWALLYARLYTVAVAFCMRVGDRAKAQDAATDAFIAALTELEPGGSVQLEWRGEESFVAFVRNRVIYRCRDRLGVEWGWINRIADIHEDAAEGDGDLLDSRVSTPATQEELVRGELLKRLLQQLACWCEICRGRPALAAVLAQMQEYVRACLIDAGRQASIRAEGGRDWSSLTLDELADAVEPERVEITRSAMYAFVRGRLGLDAVEQRNTFFLRMRQIRELVTGGPVATA